jgi:hypothetical protein
VFATTALPSERELQTHPTLHELLRMRDVGGPGPSISFIDGPLALCDRLETFSELCYVNWSYLYVTAGTSQYIVEMTVEIDGEMRAFLGGFFQTSMYAPGEMFEPGFTVACGQPGEGGYSTLGAAHAYIVRARETGDLTAANYGSFLCPPTRHIFSDGFESGATSEWSGAQP